MLYLCISPEWICRYFVSDKVFELLLQPDHEGCAGGDAVAVEPVLLGQVLPPISGLLLIHLRLSRRSEPAPALLVHLGAGSHSVHGHEKNLSRLDHAKQNLQVMENVREYFLLGDPEVGVVVVRVGAGVDDPVHVQVQIVKLGDLILLYNLEEISGSG